MSKLRKTRHEAKTIENRSQYFKLLDNSVLPSLINNSARYSYERTPQKITERIVKSQHFLYIDLDQETGCKVMQKGTPINNEEQLQKIGNSYIFNLRNLSQRNQQTLDFLYRQQESQQHKNNIRKLLKNQLDKSLSKLNTKKKFKLDYDQLKQRRKLEFDPMKLKEMVENNQLQTLNESIWIKEKRLMQKLGIVNNYILISPERQEKQSMQNSVKKSKVKSKLPALNLRTINH